MNLIRGNCGVVYGAIISILFAFDAYFRKTENQIKKKEKDDNDDNNNTNTNACIA